MNKKYTLKVPRAQYDRLGSTFELDDTYFERLLTDTDEIIFHITEQQRIRFAQYALEENRHNKRTGHWYWICQMFLPENINSWKYEE